MRYGGDEFVVILPRQNKGQALAKVQRMKRALSRTPFLHKEKINVHVTASFGLATFPYDACDKRELLAAADDCLFQSKADGKNRISVFGSPAQNHSGRGRLGFGGIMATAVTASRPCH